jgi:outer membrane protein TolC
MWLKKKIKFLFVICFATFGVSVSAQESFHLQGLIRLALEENYQIMIVRKQQQMAENMNTIGNAGFLPSVGVVADGIWNIQTTESQLYTGQTRSGTNARSDQLSAMVEANWKIFDGFAMFARRDRLGLIAGMSDSDTRFFIEQTVADLSKMYYLLIREKLLLVKFISMKDASAFRLEVEERKQSLGSGNALQHNQALMDFNNDSSMVIFQQMNIIDLEIQINRLLNRTPMAAIVLSESTIELNGIPGVNEQTEMAVRNNRDLERARIEEMLAETNVRVERGEMYPQVNVFANYSLSGQNNEIGMVESSKSHGTQFGIRVRFNLYDGGRQTTKMKNLFLENEVATINKDDVRASVESELQRLFIRYESYGRQYQLIKQSADAAEHSLTIARQQFQSGAIDGFEYRQTQLVVLQTESQLIHLSYVMKAVEIDVFRICGVLLDKMYNSE